MGLAVKELKDGYPNVEEDLKTLEAQGHVLVICGNKDGLPRMVWYNDPKLNVSISEEFKEMYHNLRVPDARDLPNELEMMPASIDPGVLNELLWRRRRT
jgi:transcription initiation factor TFIIE subunit beta